MYGEVVLVFLARLSFAAEEPLPTCGDGNEITLEVDDAGAETYEWQLDPDFFDRGGEVLDTTGTTTTIRCPQCLDEGANRYDVQVQAVDENGALTWAYAYFEQDCPPMDGADGCSSASNPSGVVTSFGW